jgi:hypothetical protein
MKLYALTRRTVLAIILCLPLMPSGFAQPKSPPEEVVVTKAFGGINFGVGLGLTLDIQRQSRVVSAAVVNNIVRISETNDAIAGIVLESHYFFVPKTTMPVWSVEPLYWGHGPFVAIEAGSSSGVGEGVINAFALGWMVGIHEPQRTFSSSPTPHWVTTYSSSSWNIGVGIRVDPKAKALGDGIVANQPLPLGEPTEVRLKTAPRYGLILVSSFSF